MRASVRTETADYGRLAVVPVRAPGVHTNRGGSARRRAQRDVALDGAPEFNEVGVAGFGREREHNGRGAVGRHAAGDEVGEHR